MKAGTHTMLPPPPPIILTQPAPQTRYLGESATFSVQLKSPAGATYQWRRNGTNIPGATVFLYVTPPLTAADDNEKIDVVITQDGEHVTSVAAPVHVGPFATPYTTAAGAKLTLYAWPGKDAVYLTQSSQLSVPVMRDLLATTDIVWDYYASATGRHPTTAQTYNGLPVIAQIDNGCGVACAKPSDSRLEFSYAEMRAVYTAQSNAAQDPALFALFDHAFDTLAAPLAYQPPDSAACIPAGLATLLRQRASMDLATHGSAVDPAGNTIAGGGSERPLIDLYAETPALNWSNTFRPNIFTLVPGATCGDLTASLLGVLIAQHGGEAFLHSFLREAAARPPARTTQDAVANFIAAASAAAHQDLTPQFQQWRWPIPNRP